MLALKEQLRNAIQEGLVLASSAKVHRMWHCLMTPGKPKLGVNH